MNVQEVLIQGGESRLRKYQRLVVGTRSFPFLIRYELTLLASSWVPGALGLLLRSVLYPGLLRNCGRGVLFGSRVMLRHPRKISIGENVVIDDSCVLDAKGRTNHGISVGRNVFIGRNTILYCQDGDIEVEEGVNIASNCQVASLRSVKIGRNVLIGAYAYLIGGGHRFEDVSAYVSEQGRSGKGIVIEDNVWIGAGAMILDNVNVGKGAIVGAGAVVVEDVPAYAVVGGVPARGIRDRRAGRAETE